MQGSPQEYSYWQKLFFHTWNACNQEIPTPTCNAQNTLPYLHQKRRVVYNHQYSCSSQYGNNSKDRQHQSEDNLHSSVERWWTRVLLSCAFWSTGGVWWLLLILEGTAEKSIIWYRQFSFVINFRINNLHICFLAKIPAIKILCSEVPHTNIVKGDQ